jgi:hypothetical protein
MGLSFILLKTFRKLFTEEVFVFGDIWSLSWSWALAKQNVSRRDVSY